MESDRATNKHTLRSDNTCRTKSHHLRCWGMTQLILFVALDLFSFPCSLFEIPHCTNMIQAILKEKHELNAPKCLGTLLKASDDLLRMKKMGVYKKI